MTLPPLRRQVLVSCDPATAYRLWIDDIAAWWPIETHSVYGAEARVAFEGDTIVETSADGETAVWGTVTEATPPALLAFTWHPGQSAEHASHVSVAFTPTGADDVTLVTLTHTGWEAYGDRAEAARREYAEGWIGVLDLLADSQPGGAPVELWFVLEHRAGPATPDSGVFSSPDFAHHLAFLSTLHADGVLVAAGALPDEAGSGMTIVRAPDAETARRVLADAQHADGSVVAGLLDVRVRPWRVAVTG